MGGGTLWLECFDQRLVVSIDHNVAGGDVVVKVTQQLQHRIGLPPIGCPPALICRKVSAPKTKGAPAAVNKLFKHCANGVAGTVSGQGDWSLWVQMVQGACLYHLLCQLEEMVQFRYLPSLVKWLGPDFTGCLKSPSNDYHNHTYNMYQAIFYPSGFITHFPPFCQIVDCHIAFSLNNPWVSVLDAIKPLGVMGCP